MQGYSSDTSTGTKIVTTGTFIIPLLIKGSFTYGINDYTKQNRERIKSLENKSNGIVENENILAFIPVFGQSIAVAQDSKPVISTKVFDAVYKVSSYALDGDVNAAGIAVLVPYQEINVETSCYGMIETLKKLNGNILPYKIVTGAYGYGGRTINQLINGKSGDPIPYPYPKLKLVAQSVKKYCDANNLKMIIPAWCWVQGESDIAVNTTDYKNQLLNIHNDWNAFCKELTGQSDDVKMICYQTASFGRGVNYDVFPFSMDIHSVVISQYELCKEDARFVMAAPLYFNEHGPYNIHLFSQDQKTLGGYEGKALFRAMSDNSYKNIYVKNITVNENIITLDIHVPCPPLVIDNNFVNYVKNAGFSVVKSDNSDIIDSVNVVYDKIIITCSENPVGCKLRYGAISQKATYIEGTDGDDFTEGTSNSVISSPDRMTGPRGNIRDSDDCTISVNNQKRKLYNIFPYINILVE